jgi:hypothetical protein
MFSSHVYKIITLPTLVIRIPNLEIFNFFSSHVYKIITLPTLVIRIPNLEIFNFANIIQQVVEI